MKAYAFMYDEDECVEMIVYAENANKAKAEGARLTDMEYTDILLAHKQMVIYNDSKCQIYNLHGSCKFDGRFDDKTLLMVPGDGPAWFSLVSRSVCELIRFH